jgi:hypothetical protein
VHDEVQTALLLLKDDYYIRSMDKEFKAQLNQVLQTAVKWSGLQKNVDDWHEFKDLVNAVEKKIDEFLPLAK